MSQKVLISAPYMQPVVDRFREIFDCHNIELIVPPVNERLSEEELLPLIGDVDGMICGDDNITERVISSAPRLRVIVKWGTGTDSIDKEACTRRAISVLNTPGAFTRPVTETVLGVIFCFTRNLISMDRGIRRGRWEKIAGVTLAEATLGVIGVGNIGKQVARITRQFSTRVLGVDPVPVPDEFVRETGIEMVSLEEALSASDIVTLHCDLNPTSYHLISKPELALMKKSAILINTSRGPVVDEPALVAALQNNEIAGAALDVFEIEPLPASSPLTQMDQVILGAHNANSSPSAWEATHQSSLRQLLQVLVDGKPS